MCELEFNHPTFFLQVPMQIPPSLFVCLLCLVKVEKNSDVRAFDHVTTGPLLTNIMHSRLVVYYNLP